MKKKSQNVKSLRIAKSIILSSLVILIGLGAVSFASAQVEFENPLGSENDDINTVIAKIFEWIRAISTWIAVLMFLVGGLMYMTSGGNTGRVQTATKIMTWTAIGFIVIFLASSILVAVLEAIGEDDAAQQALEGNVKEPQPLILSVIETLVRILGGIAIIVMLGSGLVYMTAANSARAQTAKNILTYAVVGVVIALLAQSIVMFLDDLF